MWLNWYLPFRRKAKADGPRGPGPIRRLLEKIGPTWVFSPVRRVLQAGCLLVFVGLFLYVCWPYTARPARVWSGWRPAEVDAQGGQVVVVSEQPQPEPIAPHTVLYVVDQGGPAEVGAVAFRVTAVGQRELTMEPAAPLAPQQLDRLAASFGPWSLNEADPAGWPSHYADELQSKQLVPAEAFLMLDPLMSISTAIAVKGKIWSGSFAETLLWWSLGCAGVLLLVCTVVPRGFCGYVCPLGTLLDLFDWALGRWVRRLRVGSDGWWVHLKYYLLVATLIAALLGVLLCGFVAAIPVLTRGMAFLLTPLQMGFGRGWHQVAPIRLGNLVSIVLFLIVPALGLLRPRFWCKYVCPTGAVFSLANHFRLTQRKVESSCIGCKRCVEVCPFDAIKPDFTTRVTDCTFCQTCGGACPVRAIQFVGRWEKANGKVVSGEWRVVSGEWRAETSSTLNPQPSTLNSQLTTHHSPLSTPHSLGRRRFLATTIGGVSGCLGGAGAAALIGTTGARLEARQYRPVRPPGSVPEEEFLRMCVRCGECFQACPNNVLQPLGFQQGLEGLWTPEVVADWSGCEPSCSNCGQVCPTGAIRALPLDEKRVARIGLAVVNRQTCLPYAGREACQLCVDECVTAGYHAIEFIRVGTEVDQSGQPIEDSGFLAPVVLPERCVGCGLCQTRCRAVNAAQKGLLRETAIRVEAGEGKEDRLTSGSYRAIRQREAEQRNHEQLRSLREGGKKDTYLPDFLD